MKIHNISCAIVVTHAKRPDNVYEAEILAEFVKNLGLSISKHWIAVGDYNFEKNKKTNITETRNKFVKTLNDYECEVYPNYGTITSSKQRTGIHGQPYDINKCFRRVDEEKDLIAFSSNFRLIPDKNSVYPSGDDLLPNLNWASDHKCVSVTLELKN